MWAEAGFRRRIIVASQDGQVLAGLEDDAHRFRLRVCHDGATIRSIVARTDRAPYSTCPQAGEYLATRLCGSALADVAAEDPLQHCTHLHDLACLAAFHATGPARTDYRMAVTDRDGDLARASLAIDGQTVLDWQIDGTLLVGPGDWKGRDLRALSRWKNDLSDEAARHAVLLRRAVLVSGVRRAARVARAADRGPGRLGACFTYQSGRADAAVASAIRPVDFSAGAVLPLCDFPGDLAHPVREGLS